MKRLLLLTAIFLTACGPSQEEKEEIAIITCNIMGESRNMDGAVRIREINNAREKMGEDAFLGSDEEIKKSFDNELCKELVLNRNYEAILDAKLQADREEIKEAKKSRQNAKNSYRMAVLNKVKDYEPVLTLIPSTESGFQPDVGISCTNGLGNNLIYLNLKGGVQIVAGVPREDKNCHLAPRPIPNLGFESFQFNDIESVQIMVVIFEQSKEDVSSHGLDLDKETIKIMNSIAYPVSRNFEGIPINVSISAN